MAPVLKLWAGHPVQDGNWGLDLVNELKLVEGEWSMGTTTLYALYHHSLFGAVPEAKYYTLVKERFTLFMPEEAESHLATLAKLLEQARLYHQQGMAANLPVYLVAAPDDASPPYRCSLVYEGSFRLRRRLRWGPLGRGTLLTLELTRHPAWEYFLSTPTDPRFYVMSSDFSALGGTVELDTPDCDFPLRLDQLRLGSTNVPYDSPLTEFWIGFRGRGRFGWDDFTPLWELEEASYLGPGASVVSASGASGGKKVRVDFGSSTEDLVERVRAGVIDYVDFIGGHPEHFIGKYVVLVRARVTSEPTTVELQLYTGRGRQPQVPHPPVFITSRRWKLYELGVFQIGGDRPIFLFPGWDCYLDCISLWAGRIEGSGNLDLDAAVLIPAEHFIYARQARISVSGGSGAPYVVEMATLPTDVTVVQVYHGMFNYGPAESSVHLPYLPPGGALMVAAAQRENRHVLSDTCYIFLKAQPRWRSHR